MARPVTSRVRPRTAVASATVANTMATTVTVARSDRRRPNHKARACPAAPAAGSATAAGSNAEPTALSAPVDSWAVSVFLIPWAARRLADCQHDR